MKIGECTRKNTCYDCDNKECYLHGKKESDCPKYYCDQEGNGYHNCNHCSFIDWFIDDERQRYKSESEVSECFSTN